MLWSNEECANAVMADWRLCLWQRLQISFAFCLELGHWNFTRTLGTGTWYSISTAEVQVERGHYLYQVRALCGWRVSHACHTTTCALAFLVLLLVPLKFESYNFSGPWWASHPVQPFPLINYFLLTWPPLGGSFLPIFLFVVNSCWMPRHLYLSSASLKFESFEQFYLFVSVFHYYLERSGSISILTLSSFRFVSGSGTLNIRKFVSLFFFIDFFYCFLLNISTIG